MAARKLSVILAAVAIASPAFADVASKLTCDAGNTCPCSSSGAIAAAPATYKPASVVELNCARFRPHGPQTK